MNEQHRLVHMGLITLCCALAVMVNWFTAISTFVLIATIFELLMAFGQKHVQAPSDQVLNKY